MDVKNMGLFLINARKSKNLTQKDVATLCNVSTQAVSKWERGESFPDIEILEKLSLLYDVSINELINGEKDVSPKEQNKGSLIISLTFSILVFLAYFLSFLRIRVTNGVYSLLKGYEVIINGLSGGVIIVTWIVFFILFSYLILNLFFITKVLVKSKSYLTYMVLSYLFILIVGVVGLINEDYLLLPQFIIFISSTIILTQSRRYLLNEPVHLKSNIEAFFTAIKHFFIDMKTLKKSYIKSKEEGKETAIYQVRHYMSFKKYIPFIIMYFLSIFILILLLFSIAFSLRSMYPHFSVYVLLLWVVLFVFIIIKISVSRFLFTIFFGYYLRVIFIVYFLASTLFTIGYASDFSIWLYIWMYAFISVFYLYSRILLNLSHKLVNHEKLKEVSNLTTY